jgi:hypothetical protein
MVTGLVLFTLQNRKCADSIKIITTLEYDTDGEVLGAGFVR